MAWAGDDGAGHERAHDPCRADWVDLTADHAEPTSLRWVLPTCLLALLALVVAWAVASL